MLHLALAASSDLLSLLSGVMPRPASTWQPRASLALLSLELQGQLM